MNTPFSQIAESVHISTSVANLTTFQVGGEADFIVEAYSSEEIVQVVHAAHRLGIPYLILSGGTNILFHDDGFRGVVIRPMWKEKTRKESQLTFSAGVPMPEAVKFAESEFLTGFEEWTALPGTIGGAVRGNAGSFGLEVKDILVSATVLTKDLELKEFSPEDCDFSYRMSRIKRWQEIVLEATFQLKTGDPDKISTKGRDIVRQRIKKQPPGRSAGSFFKNPEGKSAGLLIDEAGLKGLEVGQAIISPHHGNFIQNQGGATGAEILELTNRAKDGVFKKFGIILEEEVKLVPESPC